MKVLEEFVASGAQPRNSDAYTINGQPGDLYPCSSRRKLIFFYFSDLALIPN